MEADVLADPFDRQSIALSHQDPDVLLDARRAAPVVGIGGRRCPKSIVGEPLHQSVEMASRPGEIITDLRGQPDLFDFRLQITQVGAADELAAAASLVMGQAAEGTPVVHARGFPYPLREGSFNELVRPRHQDLFR
jgi:hypothetical protein